MSVKEKILSDIKIAMRAQNKEQLSALRLIAAAIKQIEVDERIEVDESRMLGILNKLAKQRNESISQYQSAGRDDLVAKEQFELDIIKNYLPQPLSEREVEQLVGDAISESGASDMRDMGKVMALLKPKLQGRADMAQVSAQIKEKLSGA